MKNRYQIAFGTLLIYSATAFAHPGHGRGGEGFDILHYLTEPVHAFPAIALSMSIAWFRAYRRRCREEQNSKPS